jgi:hypothetical protein
MLSSERGNHYNLFRQMLQKASLDSVSPSQSVSSIPEQGKREDRIRSLLEKCEYITLNGNPSLPFMVTEIRKDYYRDFQFLLDSLSSLGNELKSFPGTYPLFFPGFLTSLSSVLPSFFSFRLVSPVIFVPL